MATQKKPARQGLTKALIDSIVDGVDAKMAERQAPAVLTDDRFARRTREDLNRQALDEGLPKESLEARLQSEDRSFRQGGRDLKQARQFTAIARSNGRNHDGTVDLGSVASGRIASSYIGHLAMARGDRNEAYRAAKASGAHPVVTRALGESTFAGGGAGVAVEIQNDLIELLYSTTAYLQTQPTRVQLASGVMRIPGIATGATGTWIGESENITKSEQTFRDVSLSLKKLAVLTPISNDLIFHASQSMEDVVRQDLVESASVTIDSAMIRGLGTSYEPLGLKSNANASSTFDANATVNVANITSDLTLAQRKQADLKVKMLRASWLMSPRSFYHLMALRDGNNNLVFAPELAQGRLMGKPVFVTHNIPDTLGSGNKSEVYLVSAEHELFGEGVGPDAMRIEMFENAAYYNGSSVVSGISKDESVVRLVQKVDRASRQAGKNITLMEAVAWGA